jgi:predicted acylesterase/phospholipase RssA
MIRATASLSSHQSFTGRQSRSKTALVLAGGGIAGVVYEVGALRAIDDLLVDYTVNDFDIYVGTSAGSLVSAFVANGFSPTETMQVMDSRHPEISGIKVDDVFHTNLSGLIRRLGKFPRTVYNIFRHGIAHPTSLAISDILWELSQVLPAGIYDGRSLERYLRQILTSPGNTNRFDRLNKELYIVATALETGERAVFGLKGKSIVPISQAVAASSAVPILYRPGRIFDRDYLDGGLHGSASIDLAIEAGAKLVVCINPLVPLNTTTFDNPHLVRDAGIQGILNQTVRTIAYAGIRYHIKNLQMKYPDVDIILIQPSWDDVRMFSVGPMHYRSRLEVAEHGFETVTVGVLKNYEYFRNVLSRHNIELTKELATVELEEMHSSGMDPIVMQQIIERDKDATSLTTSLLDLEAGLRRLQDSVSSA